MAAVPATTFPRFSELPRELRLKIFEDAIVLFPRIVEICQLKREWSSSAGFSLEAYRDVEEKIEASAPESSSYHDIVTAAGGENSVTTQNVAGESIDLKKTDQQQQQLSEPIASGSGPTPQANDDPVADAEVNDTMSNLNIDDDDDDDDDDSSSDSSESSEPGQLPNPHPFYSPTSPHPLLLVNSESRWVALRHYPLHFPNPPHHPALIRINLAIDTLFFPAWAFRNDIAYFEFACPAEVRASIRKLAFEALVWYSFPDDFCLNGQVNLELFRGLEELVMVERKPGPSGCGCCHEFDKPEVGAVSFRFEDDDGGERKVLRADETIAVGEVDPIHEHLQGWKDFDEKRLGSVQAQFERLESVDPTWKRPGTVRFASLLRNGEDI